VRNLLCCYPIMKILRSFLVCAFAFAPWGALAAEPYLATIINKGLFEPYGVTTDSDGNYFLTDASHRVFSYVPATGILTNIAGVKGVPGYNNGPAFLAQFSAPKATVTFRGGLAVADSGNHLLRFIKDPTTRIPIVSDLAGFRPLDGSQPLPGRATDGPANAVTFSSPIGLATDGANLFIADSKNNAIRMLYKNAGVDYIKTIASGLNQPSGLALDGSGNIYVSDTHNNNIKILKLQADGTYAPWSLLAGSSGGQSGTNDSFFADQALFNLPGGLAWITVDPANPYLLVCDTGNHTLRRVYFDPGLTEFFGHSIWSVDTYAGLPLKSGYADGLRMTTQLSSPAELKDISSSGQQNILVMDTGNNALRRIQPGGPSPQVAAPVIGVVHFVADPTTGELVSQLAPIPVDRPIVLNNEATIAVLAETDTTTKYSTDGNPPLGQNAKEQVPTYQNGVGPSRVPGTIVESSNIKTTNVHVIAVSRADGRQTSPLAEAQIKFKVGTPSIDGANAVAFAIKSVTTNATMCYVIVDPGYKGAVTNIWLQFPGHKIYSVVNGTPTHIPYEFAMLPTAIWIQGTNAFYESSDTVFKIFNQTSANQIAFGFNQPAEASSQFLAMPGQTFFVPVTLNLLDSGQTIYSLQFNISNSPANVFGLPDAPAVTDIGFQSSLRRPVPGLPGVYFTITNQFMSFITNQSQSGMQLTASPGFVVDSFRSLESFATKLQQQADPVSIYLRTRLLPTTITALNAYQAGGTVSPLLQTDLLQDLNAVINGPSIYDAQRFQNVSLRVETVQLLGPNTQGEDLVEQNRLLLEDAYPQEIRTILGTPSEFTRPNLIGVGWLDRYGENVLYDSTKQDLISFSQARDKVYSSVTDGKVILGNYFFKIPANAVEGQQYQIQIGRPSSTADGISRENFIDAPTIVSAAEQPINALALHRVTLSNAVYFAGDIAPFGWFNAGDFGDNEIHNNDVLQIFESAVYWGEPGRFMSAPTNSDFFDAMDTSDALFHPERLPLAPGPSQLDQIIQGDGQINVDDVYVAFRRSLDPSLHNVARHWVSGSRVSYLTNNLYYGLPQSVQPTKQPTLKGANLPASALATGDSIDPATVRFTVTDAQVQPGQSLLVPIRVQITGKYPVRVLMLNINVEPLDGSPPLTVPVKFTAVLGLGTPALSESWIAANFAGAWLDESVTGVWATNFIGSLQVVIPANASPASAYRIAFPHISASPNGLGLLPQSSQPGLITVTDRSASSWNDGIPDSWRLRYFGSVSNLLSAATADADGDGVPNWAEYQSGTDPVNKDSALRLTGSQVGADSGTAGPATLLLRWPTTVGLNYVIEYCHSMLDPQWIPLSSNLIGTGKDLEYADVKVPGQIRYYRVRVAE
jgi:hypothetical protein